MQALEVVAQMKVRPGQISGFTSQVAEILHATRSHDTHTLRCDWFLDEDREVCEVHELFPDEHGLIEHKMNTMEATAVLFQDYASDHHSTIYGEVSADFINLVTERMGPPTIFTFLQGLESGSTAERPGRRLEVIAALKVRDGQIDGFKNQIAEVLRVAQLEDTETLRYDWFLDADGTACEVHEMYRSSEGLIEHNEHVMAARGVLFRDFAFDHRMRVYGEISDQLRGLFQTHAGGVTEFSYLNGLEATTGV